MEFRLRFLTTVVLHVFLFTTLILHSVNTTYHRADDDNISNRNYSNTIKVVTNGTKQKIKIGVILPFRLDNTSRSAYHTSSDYTSGAYYASAMYLALDGINNNKNLLPNHELELVWGDTECNAEKAISIQKKMIDKESVDAFIGGSCDACVTLAKNAGDTNIPMISHRCIEEELSQKDIYPTFARTERIGHQLTPAIHALLNYFKWQKIALVVENSRMYKLTYKDVQKKFSNQIIETKWIETPSKYEHDEHYQQVVEDMRYLSTRTRVIILIMSLQVAKECLIAGTELNMVDGTYIFVAFEVDTSHSEGRQESTFKWVTADYAPKFENQKSFLRSYIDRSTSLCIGWESTLLMMIKLSDGLSEQKINKREVGFEERVRKGMKKFFSSSVYDSGITIGGCFNINASTKPRYAENLYDAIMLYAIAVNVTINQGGDYTDGRVVAKNMKNKVFNSVEGHEIFLNNNNEIQYPFTVYHYGKQPSREDCACHLRTQGNMPKCENSFPKMEPIAEIDMHKINISKNVNGTVKQEIELKFQYAPIKNSHMYWPGDLDLKHIPDEPVCGFDGSLCKKAKDQNTILIAAGISFVCVVSIIIAVLIYRKYKSTEKLNCGTYVIKDRMLLIPDEEENQL